METLFAKQDRLLSLTSTEIIRTLMYQINWDAQLVAIKGPRGVGKTTLSSIMRFIAGKCSIVRWTLFISPIILCWSWWMCL